MLLRLLPCDCLLIIAQSDQNGSKNQNKQKNKKTFPTLCPGNPLWLIKSWPNKHSMLEHVFLIYQSSRWKCKILLSGYLNVLGRKKFKKSKLQWKLVQTSLWLACSRRRHFNNDFNSDSTSANHTILFIAQWAGDTQLLSQHHKGTTVFQAKTAGS